MLLSIFNLLIRWLFFIAVIWPVQAEANISDDVNASAGADVSASASAGDEKIYWPVPDIKISIPKNIKSNICTPFFVDKYFKAEKVFANYSLTYTDYHIKALKAFYKQLKLDLQNKTINKKNWNAKNLGLQNLYTYSESLYDISDNVNIFFNNLEVCWNIKPDYFMSLKRIVKNYRLQDFLIAEITLYFADSLNQVLNALDSQNLSNKNKTQILSMVKNILDTSKKMKTMLVFNYKVLSSDIDYIAQVYWGI
ncbi:MAG: hypothetical protein HAW60_04915 [Bdellovibrionales bacterium]|nr:hypothetical protein [Bdellovibrionales bacterium]